jgi:hypothetical protein
VTSCTVTELLSNVVFHHPVALYRSDIFGAFVPSECNVVHYSFFRFHYTFPPNWPSSGVQVVMVKDSAAHCNAVIFPSIVVASGYFGYVNKAIRRKNGERRCT